MVWLDHWFRRRGYRTLAHSYRSVRRTLDDNASALAHKIATAGTKLAAPDGCLDVVCHSYGGLVMLRILALELPLRVRRMVLLGSPLGGSSVGRRFAAHPVGHLLLGRSGPLWQNGVSVSIPEGIEVGAIAGSRPLGMGRMVARIEGTSDGVVMLEETRHSGLADHVIVDCAHTGMLFSAQVARQAEHFLQHGRFSR